MLHLVLLIERIEHRTTQTGIIQQSPEPVVSRHALRLSDLNNGLMVAILISQNNSQA